MTTTVKVTAACNAQTCVRVQILGGISTANTERFLMNGQEAEISIHDDQMVKVKEVPLSAMPGQEEEPAAAAEEDTGGEASSEEPGGEEPGGEDTQED